jgi:hypothetical protein
VSEGTNPAYETVNVTDSGSGVGPDTITNASGTTNGGTFTGTVTWPLVPGTMLDETSSSQSPALDYPSTTAYPVTATKASGDASVGDTKWTFDATNWLGEQTYCH